MKKYLFDATYINNGGGLILLDYLIEKIHISDLDVFYVFDKRILGRYDFIPLEKRIYIKSSLYVRFLFYLRKSRLFDVIFSFNNLPPFYKVRATSITYLHQRLFLEKQKNTKFFVSLLLRLKGYVLFLIKKNSDLWMVQTNSMKNLLVDFGVSESKILILPFFPELTQLYRENLIRPRVFGFVYVSSGAEHKNLTRLIQAFCSFYKKYHIGYLILTLDQIKNNLLCKKIISLNEAGIPIINKGSISNSDVIKLYQTYEYCIYPSLSESFGLGIIESIELGCKLLAADLPYVSDICIPSELFNPLDVDSISGVMEKCLIHDVGFSKLKVDNNINNLIYIFKNA